ncbi:MAG: SMC-Scp complex subunit ScpB [Acidimicrobiia bacterium]
MSDEERDTPDPVVPDDRSADEVDISDASTEIDDDVDLTEPCDELHLTDVPATNITVEAIRAFESIVMVASEPVDPQLLAQLLEISQTEVEQIATHLARCYTADQRGFQLARVAGGYRFQSHPDCAPYVERFVLEGQTSRLSSAALETLAIVAYKQPISRAQIASIRGVDPDGVLRTLQQRGYVSPTGKDPGPGQAVLWGTTSAFLERLGLDSLSQLPPIAAFVPGADVVEALEHGLRIEPASPAPKPAATPSYPPQSFAPRQAVESAAEADEVAAEEGETTELASPDPMVSPEVMDPIEAFDPPEPPSSPDAG